MSNNKSLSGIEVDHLLHVLEQRFNQNMHRHSKIAWPEVLIKVEGNSQKLWSLYQMEITGGEPDIAGYDQETNEYLFIDCSKESPPRRSLCYDQQARQSRKKNKPENSACELAAFMGIELLTESQYRQLQQLEELDTKTSSWLMTAPAIRQHGGAIFGDFRYGQVFIYHNGAASYYAARGFRGVLRV